LHVADGGDGATEPDRAEFQEVGQDAAESDRVAYAGLGVLRVARDAIGVFIAAAIHLTNVTTVAFRCSGKVVDISRPRDRALRLSRGDAGCVD
jgi:hypothetical protein